MEKEKREDMSHVDPARASNLLQWLDEDEDRPVYVHASSSPKVAARSVVVAATEKGRDEGIHASSSNDNGNALLQCQLEESLDRVALLTDALSSTSELLLMALADRQKHYIKMKTVLNNRSLIAADLVKEMFDAQTQQRAELAQATQIFQMLGQRQQQANAKKR